MCEHKEMKGKRSRFQLSFSDNSVFFLSRKWTEQRRQINGIHVRGTYVLVRPVVLGKYVFIRVRRAVRNEHNGAVTLRTAAGHVHLPPTSTPTQGRVTRTQPRRTDDESFGSFNKRHVTR